MKVLKTTVAIEVTGEGAVNVIDSATAQADAEKEADKQWEILKTSIPGYSEALEARRRQREDAYWEAQRREDCRLLGKLEEAFNAASEACDNDGEAQPCRTPEDVASPGELAPSASTASSTPSSSTSPEVTHSASSSSPSFSHLRTL